MATHVTLLSMIRGMGAALALPWLRRFSGDHATAKSTSRRCGCVFEYVPNGVHLPAWFAPGRAGAGWSIFPRRCSPSRSRAIPQQLFGSHAQHGGHQWRQRGLRPRPGRSQLPHRRPGKENPGRRSRGHLGRPALRDTSAMPPVSPASSWAAVLPLGQLSFGYSGTYEPHISWRTPTSPAPYELDPKVVFDRLFTWSGNSLYAGRPRRSRFLQEEHARLRAGGRQPPPRPRRRERSAQKLVAVSDGSARSSVASSTRHVSRSIPQRCCRAHRNPQDFDEHLRLMCDLMVRAAFQTDSTRAASFFRSPRKPDRNYPWLGFTEGHHELSHHGGDREQAPQAPRDRSLPCVDLGLHGRKDDVDRGSRQHDALLDNSMVLYGSGARRVAIVMTTSICR